MPECQHQRCGNQVPAKRLMRGGKYCSDRCRWNHHNEQLRQGRMSTARDVIEAAMAWYANGLPCPNEKQHLDRLYGACHRHAEETDT